MSATGQYFGSYLPCITYCWATVLALWVLVNIDPFDERAVVPSQHSVSAQKLLHGVKDILVQLGQLVLVHLCFSTMLGKISQRLCDVTVSLASSWPHEITTVLHGLKIVFYFRLVIWGSADL